MRPPCCPSRMVSEEACGHLPGRRGLPRSGELGCDVHPPRPASLWAHGAQRTLVRGRFPTRGPRIPSVPSRHPPPVRMSLEESGRYSDGCSSCSEMFMGRVSQFFLGFQEPLSRGRTVKQGPTEILAGWPPSLLAVPGTLPAGRGGAVDLAGGGGS